MREEDNDSQRVQDHHSGVRAITEGLGSSGMRTQGFWLSIGSFKSQDSDG